MIKVMNIYRIYNITELLKGCIVPFKSFCALKVSILLGLNIKNMILL